MDLEQLFQRLGAADPNSLAKTIQHFTSKEAGRRDKIVMSYFGERNVLRIVDSIVESVLSSPKLPENARVLDLGAGSGFFTVKIAEKIHARLPRVVFYAMDVTPSMLLSLAKKGTQVLPFIGLAENVRDSVQQARRHFKIPLKFDVVFSTLMLHHSPQPEKVFENIGQVLKKNGKAVVLDLCEHRFEEFKEEMGDVHLGFKLEGIKETAGRYFSDVRVKKLPGIYCKSSGRSAEIFVATMQKPL